MLLVICRLDNQYYALLAVVLLSLFLHLQGIQNDAISLLELPIFDQLINCYAALDYFLAESK